MPANAKGESGKPAVDSDQRPETDGGVDAEDVDVGVVPPDGGWGWMVVFSSFMIHIIADGIVYSFGIFFVEFVDYFDASKYSKISRFDRCLDQWHSI